jgi:hypothetical protein
MQSSIAGHFEGNDNLGRLRPARRLLIQSTLTSNFVYFDFGTVRYVPKRKFLQLTTIVSMPRLARAIAVGFPHHVTQRGTDRDCVFFTNADREVYLDLLRSLGPAGEPPPSGLLPHAESHPSSGRAG